MDLETLAQRAMLWLKGGQEVAADRHTRTPIYSGGHPRLAPNDAAAVTLMNKPGNEIIAIDPSVLYGADTNNRIGTLAHERMHVLQNRDPRLRQKLTPVLAKPNIKELAKELLKFYPPQIVGDEIQATGIERSATQPDIIPMLTPAQLKMFYSVLNPGSQL